MTDLVKEIDIALADDTESMYDYSLKYQVADNDIDRNYYRLKFDFYKKDLQQIYNALEGLHSALYLLDTRHYYKFRDLIGYYLSLDVSSEKIEVYRF